jgi:Haem-binding domain
MRVLLLVIVFVIFALIAFGNSLSRKQTTATSDVRDCPYAHPFRGSEGEKTLARACGNCHSNQTVLPWYGHVAPVSWLIHRHIREGREELNFSEWTTYSAQRRHNELELICGVVSNGRMSPASYRVLHPESRLQAQDKKVICAWTANESKHEK